MLTTGCSFDLVEEFTNVLFVTHRNFFNNVFTKRGKGLCDKLICFTETEEGVRYLVGLFERVGHPGFMSSVDCVHIAWDKCPAGFLSLCSFI